MHGHGVALGIIFGDGGVRLRLHLANLGAVIALFHDQIGVFHTGIHVAQLVFHIPLDIAGPVFVQIDGAVAHGVFGCVIGGQLLIGKLDQINGRLGGRHIYGGDAGDRLAPVADPVPGQGIFKAGDGQDAIGLIAIIAGDHGDDTWQGGGLGNIDADDLGMGYRASKDAPDEAVIRNKVCRVHGLARYFLRAVDQGFGNADGLHRF